MSQPSRTVVYTDGACSGNPGPGGWGWVVVDGAFANGSEPHSTNQRMEITAAWRAVEALEGPLEVRSDSTYVVNCFRDRWWEGWLARNWHNSARKPVANRDLWEPFIQLVQRRNDVVFTWVKGHGSDPWNDRADRLAVEAMRAQSSRSGPATPGDLGPADQVGSVSRPADRADVPEAAARAGVPGHPVAVLGHQPPEIGGFEANPWADAVRARLKDILAAKAAITEDLVVVSGLRLGSEQLGAEAALEAGLPLVVVLPYPDPDARWPAASRRRFAQLCQAAVEVVVLSKQAPSTPARAGAAMNRRDAWLARQCREAILVWDGQDDRLARLHRSLVDHLGEDVWVLDPREVR